MRKVLRYLSPVERLMKKNGEYAKLYRSQFAKA